MENKQEALERTRLRNVYYIIINGLIKDIFQEGVLENVLCVLFLESVRFAGWVSVRSWYSARRYKKYCPLCGGQYFYRIIMTEKL